MIGKVCASCQVAHHGRACAKSLGANVNNDGGTVTSTLLLDTTVATMEMTAGFEAARVVQGNILFAQFAGEWQNWFNYSAA